MKKHFKSLYEAREFKKAVTKFADKLYEQMNSQDDTDIRHIDNSKAQTNVTEFFTKVITALAKENLIKKESKDNLTNQIEYCINKYLYPATKYNENKGVLFCKTIKKVCTPQNLDNIENKLNDYFEDNKKNVEWDNTRKVVSAISNILWKECEMIVRENPNLKRQINEN